MSVKARHAIFIAMPYDAATWEMYGRIARQLRRDYPQLELRSGTEQIGPSPNYPDLESFKAQNSTLFSRFVAEIERADIFLADLSHNNPNVLLELGIALCMNKPILRVSGRDLIELGFDVRGFDVRRYRGQDEIKEEIYAYLEKYFAVKNLPLAPAAGKMFWRDSRDQYPALRGFAANSNWVFKSHEVSCPWRVRDAEVGVRFEFGNTNPTDSWFGVYFRYGMNQFVGSYLVYVRNNGHVALAEYPGPREVSATQEAACDTSQGIDLSVGFDSDTVRVRVNDNEVLFEGSGRQAFGRISVASWNADVIYRDVRVVNRDVLNPDTRW